MPEEKVVEKKPEEKPAEAPDKIAELAMKMGWNPDHEGGDRPFKSAEDFILSGREMQDTTFKQLKSQRRETSELKAGFEALKTHNEKVYKVEVAKLKRELNTLKRQRKVADEDGDESLVRELDKEIKDIEKIPTDAPIQESKFSPTFKKWLDKNDWYDTDEEMRDYADAQSYDKKLLGLPEAKIYAEIRKRTKKMFPEKFEEVKKEEPKPKAPAVEGSTPVKKTKTKFTRRDLNEEQEAYLKTFEERGIMTAEEYIADLVKIGELK